MNQEETIDIHFTMNLPVKTLFNFIIRPENMVLYTGFFLIPGILSVESSDAELLEQ